MAQTQIDQAVTCYRCGEPILSGEGRYNVLPRESYCSWRCLQRSLPHIAEAIAQFVKELRQVEDGVCGRKDG